MRYAIIACKIFTRQLSYLVSTHKDTFEIFYLEQGLHNTPDLLRETLKNQVDKIDNMQLDKGVKKKFDAILLAYGLCSNGVLDISSKTLPIVVPRCDDCIALFLGSEKRYLEIFNSMSGIYWYNNSWIEIGSIPNEEKYKKMYEEYEKEYGADNAKYLVDIELNSMKNYEAAVYIKSDFYNDEEHQKITKEASEYLGFKYTEVKEDLKFLKKLLDGKWDSKDFLILKPNEKLVLTHDEKIFKGE